MFKYNHSLRILVIDGNKMDKLLTSTLISEYGHEVVFAHNKDSAFDALKKQHIDLILMEICLENERGEDICRQIKMEIEYESTPIIALSNSDNPNDVKPCFEIGMKSFIPKPLDNANFELIIHPILHKADLGRTG